MDAKRQGEWGQGDMMPDLKLSALNSYNNPLIVGLIWHLNVPPKTGPGPGTTSILDPERRHMLAYTLGKQCHIMLTRFRGTDSLRDTSWLTKMSPRCGAVVSMAPSTC